jgi:shikimate dehydrogenase
VTMPGKQAALAVAATASTRARRLGVANTLVRAEGGWAADCTDVDGVAGALRAAGALSASSSAGASGSSTASGAVLLGAGGTASAAVGALGAIGHATVTVVVRDPARAADTRAVAQNYGMGERALRFDEVRDDDLAQATVLVNTTPAGAVDEALADRLVGALPAGAVVLDAVYHPWPTPLAAAATRRGLAVATGLDMLLHQAFGQVEQFTGRPAPRAAMHEALVRATGFAVRSP